MPDAQRAEIAKLESLHADHPEGRIFTHLAEAYRKAGELERAREVLAEGIERHPDYSSAHVVLARVLVDQGEREEAESEFRRVLQLDSHNLVALRSLGELARGAGRTDEALEFYRRLLEVEPSDEDVREAIREIEEGPAAAAGSSPAAPVEDAMDAAWASDGGNAGSLAAEEEPWTVGGTGEEKDASTEVTWPPGDEPAGPAPEEAAPERPVDPAVEAGAAEDAEVVDGRADAPSDHMYDEYDSIPDVGEPGMLTETIAQVYARQGLYDRAAEVYRQLLRVRPDDAALRTRLEELEALAAAGDAGAAPDRAPETEQGAAAVEAGTARADEPDVEPPHGLPALETESPAADVEPLPGLETREPESVPRVAPLGGLETDEIDPETGLRTDEPPWQNWSEPEAPEVAEPAEQGTGEDDAVEHDAPEHEAPEHEAPEHEAEAVESVWTGAGGASGAEASPYAWAEGEPEEEEEDGERSAEPIDAYLRSLLGWGGASAPAGGDTEAWDGGAEPAEAPDAAGRPDAGGATEAAEGAPAGGAPGGGDADEPPEDDDLDTFRSWLESLKQ